MTPPVAPYVCAVCRAPVVAGARFCAGCGTPFSERPPLRVAPAVTPAPRVPVAPPVAHGRPPASPAATSYAPPPERSTAALWIGGVVVLFVAALVGAYLLFARPAGRDTTAPDTVERELPPGHNVAVPPPDLGGEEIGEIALPPDDPTTGLDPLAPVLPETDVVVEDDAAVQREAERQAEAEREAQREAEREAEARRAAEQRERERLERERLDAEATPPPPSPQLGAAWSTYQNALAAYQQAVRSAGSPDKRQAEIAAVCSRLVSAGDAVLRLPGRERYASQIARDRRNC